jgi:hypothetical protein
MYSASDYSGGDVLTGNQKRTKPVSDAGKIYNGAAESQDRKMAHVSKFEKKSSSAKHQGRTLESKVRPASPYTIPDPSSKLERPPGRVAEALHD